MISFVSFVMLPTWLAILWRKYFAKQTTPARQFEAPRSILVVRLDQLGDMVLTTPLFRELKRLYPGARTTLVAPKQYKAIFTTNRNIDEILSPEDISLQRMPLRARRLISAVLFCGSKLRHRQFDLAVSPRWDVDENHATLLCVMANARRRTGHSSLVSPAKQKLNRWFDAAFDFVVPPGPLRHELDSNLAIVEALGGKIASRRPEICLTANDRAFAVELLKYHDERRMLVAVGIGGRAASRQWPLERYADVITELNQLRPVQPVIVCSEDEDAEASALSVMLPLPPYIVSGLPLRTVCGVLERCQLYLGNDTGTAHLAAAMRCRTVVVSRHPMNGDPGHANSPLRFAPRGAETRILQPATGAGSCTSFCQSSAPHCILSISADQAVAAAMELLPSQVPMFPKSQARSLLPPCPELEPAGMARLA